MTQGERLLGGGQRRPDLAGNLVLNIQQLAARTEEYVAFAAHTTDPEVQKAALFAVSGLLEAQLIITGQGLRLDPVATVMDKARRGIMNNTSEPNPGGKQ